MMKIISVQVRNKTIIGLKWIRYGKDDDVEVRNKTIIGLKFKIEDGLNLPKGVRNKTIIGLK